MANGDAGDMYIALNSIQRKLKDWFTQLKLNKHVRGQPISLGTIESRLKKHYELKYRKPIVSKHLYLTPGHFQHAYRDEHLADGIEVPESEFIAFVKSHKNMELFYRDGSYIYTDRKYKFAIKPNEKMKIKRNKVIKVALITAYKVTDPNEFDNSLYTKII